MAGKLIAFRVDESVYQKLAELGNPSKVAKKIVLDYLSDEKNDERKRLEELEKRTTQLYLILARTQRRQENVEAVLRKAGLWR